MLLVIQQVVGIDASHLDAVSGPWSNGPVLCQDTLVLHPCFPLGSGADTCVHLVGHEKQPGLHLRVQLPQLFQHADEGLRGDQRLRLVLIRADDGVGIGQHDGKPVVFDVARRIEEHIAVELLCVLHQLLHRRSVRDGERLDGIRRLRAELLLVDLTLQARRLLQVRVDDADVLLPIDEIVRQKKT